MALSTAQQNGSDPRSRHVADDARRRVSPLAPSAVAFLGDSLHTIPNMVTVARTLASVVIAAVALAEGDSALLAVSYSVYWTGDMLDGWLARRLHMETRLGAVLDIISDRACMSILCVGLVSQYPGFGIVLIPFFLSFMVVDAVLSLAFLCWPLLSPNYFGVVDRSVYRLNWSPVAKSLNTAGVILLAVAGALWASLGLVILLGAIKIWSAMKVQRLIRAHLRGARR